MALPQKLLLLIGVATVVGFLINNERNLDRIDHRPAVSTQRLSPSKRKMVDDSRLKIVWLASFPNSGTSYTLRLVQGLTHTWTASNYGVETTEELLKSIRPDLNQTGPYWTNFSPEDVNTYREPTRFALTKTHCGGRCVDCFPKNYVQSMASFQDACLTTSQPVSAARRGDPSPTPTQRQYEAANVAKMIHLIRDPLDNIVSRYHNWRFNHAHPGLGTVADFRLWCAALHNKTAKEERKLNIWERPPILQTFLETVPCASDFYRYVQWHNLAFAMATDEDWETMVLHYEDYEPPMWNTTSDRLLDYLQLERWSNGDQSTTVVTASNFVGGRRYGHSHFTEKERQIIERGLTSMSSRKTWQHLSRYFEDQPTPKE